MEKKEVKISLSTFILVLIIFLLIICFLGYYILTTKRTSTNNVANTDIQNYNTNVKQENKEESLLNEEEKNVGKIENSKEYVYIKNHFEKEVIANLDGQKHMVKVDIPFINVDSKAAKDFNKKIEKLCPTENDVKNYSEISTEYNIIKDEILSVKVIVYYDKGHVQPYIININLKTGEELKDSKVIETIDKTNYEIIMSVCKYLSSESARVSLDKITSYEHANIFIGKSKSELWIYDDEKANAEIGIKIDL